jgi:hypothetical protein
MVSTHEQTPFEQKLVGFAAEAIRKRRIELTIDESGGIHCLFDDPAVSDLVSLADNRSAAVRRASWVVPYSRALRLAFRVLRLCFGDNGRVAKLTRRFPGRWLADMAPSAGPVLGPFATRAEAIAAERRWLRDNRF